MSFFASELPMMVEFCVFAPTGLGEGCIHACDMVVLAGFCKWVIALEGDSITSDGFNLRVERGL